MRLFNSFENQFSRKKAIYDYVLLPTQRYNFIGETVTPGNLTKNKQQQNADYRGLHVKPCCKQMVVSEKLLSKTYNFSKGKNFTMLPSHIQTSIW